MDTDRPTLQTHAHNTSDKPIRIANIKIVSITLNKHICKAKRKYLWTFIKGYSTDIQST